MAISQRWLRQWHGWLAWAVGLQVLLWMASGIYMSAAPIDWIHGDHWVRADERELTATLAGSLPPAELQRRHPGLERFTLKLLGGKAVYEVQTGASIVLVDAATGDTAPPPDAAAIRELAQSRFAGPGAIRAVERLDTAPQEVATRPAPLWRVTFEGASAPTLYYSAATGELVAKRFAGWRIFDALWMFHIMDYDTRDDVNNALLRTAAVAALVFAVSGIALLIVARRRTSPALRGRLPARPWPYRLHRAFVWIVGAQVLLWVASGLTMSLLDHETVSGHDYRRKATPVAVDLSQAVPASAVMAAYGGTVRSVALLGAIDGPVYLVRGSGGLRRYDAKTGSPKPVDAALAAAIARADYAGPGLVQAPERLASADLETRGHEGPIWRVPVEDDRDTTIYVSALGGDVLERRNRSWRLFDIAWMLHIMDYRERTHFNHPLLVLMAGGGLFLAISGFVLLVRRWRGGAGRAARGTA